MESELNGTGKIPTTKKKKSTSNEKQKVEKTGDYKCFAAEVNHSCTQISTATELPSAYQHAWHDNLITSPKLKANNTEVLLNYFVFKDTLNP